MNSHTHQFTREQLLNVHYDLAQLISNGQWDVSKTNLQRCHHAFRNFESARRGNMIGCIAAAAFGIFISVWATMVMGFSMIGIFIFVAIAVACGAFIYELNHLPKKRDQYRFWAVSFLNGTLVAKSGAADARELPSAADEIAKLHKLKQDGALSDEEFQAAKRKLVG